ncbi:hypothetical protein RJ640_027909 [Escallonia rubra]|uniref:Pectinesterase inhibitor domain-containing protein n=1 Tax=Escallonia rubra TaxID=112253 RepID=A0AA88USD8_9ASTE|nr:hypothetical protein RJ640_027909 [Escallonia rubra]
MLNLSSGESSVQFSATSMIIDKQLPFSVKPSSSHVVMLQKFINLAITKTHYTADEIRRSSSIRQPDCTAVSKPWCALIDSPKFIKMHLNRSKTSSILALIFEGRGTLYSVQYDSLQNATELDTRFENSNIVDVYVNPFAGVGKDLVGSGKLLEGGGGDAELGELVRVALEGKPAVGGVDLVGGAVAATGSDKLLEGGGGDTELGELVRGGAGGQAGGRRSGSRRRCSRRQAPAPCIGTASPATPCYTAFRVNEYRMNGWIMYNLLVAQHHQKHHHHHHHKSIITGKLKKTCEGTRKPNMCLKLLNFDNFPATADLPDIIEISIDLAHLRGKKIHHSFTSLARITNDHQVKKHYLSCSKNYESAVRDIKHAKKHLHWGYYQRIIDEAIEASNKVSDCEDHVSGSLVEPSTTFSKKNQEFGFLCNVISVTTEQFAHKISLLT